MSLIYHIGYITVKEYNDFGGAKCKSHGGRGTGMRLCEGGSAEYAV
jgi:hypothetical protein